MFNIRFDTILARADIQHLAMQLSDKNVKKGLASAMTRAVATGKTRASSLIRSEYKIRKRDLDKNMGSTRAGQKYLKASLYAHGIPLRARDFRYSKTKKGVKVNVKGKSILIPGAFIATMKNGHKGIFARGRYTSTGFEFRNKRINKQKDSDGKYGSDTPIAAMNTLSQGAMLRQPKVIKPVMKRVEMMLNIRVEHELKRLIAGIGK